MGLRNSIMPFFGRILRGILYLPWVSFISYTAIFSILKWLSFVLRCRFPHLTAEFQFCSQNSLGGRVRFLVTGSAPLRDDVMIFLRCALGCQVRLNCSSTFSFMGKLF